VTESVQTYFGDVLANFSAGVQLDLRVKMALDLLKGGAFTDAEAALNQATRLVELAGERGLMKDLPSDDELSAPMKSHLRRSLRVQIYQQSEGPRLAAEEQAHKIAPATIFPMAPNGSGGPRR
jgi:hypothetical protein